MDIPNSLKAANYCLIMGRGRGNQSHGVSNLLSGPRRQLKTKSLASDSIETVERVGVTTWRRRSNKSLHREDGPAIILEDGARWLVYEGREIIGPAEIYYHRGQLHRDGGPAIDPEDGDKMWYQHDKCHCEDGPAVEGKDGTNLWYKDSWLHREDGPAVEGADGYREWYLKGEEYTEADWQEELKKRGVK